MIQSSRLKNCYSIFFARRASPIFVPKLMQIIGEMEYKSYEDAEMSTPTGTLPVVTIKSNEIRVEEPRHAE